MGVPEKPKETLVYPEPSYEVNKAIEYLRTLMRGNKKAMEYWDKGVCVHCGKEWREEEIKEYAHDDSAICPHCHVDAIILPAISSPIDLNRSLIRLFSYFQFEVHSIVTEEPKE